MVWRGAEVQRRCDRLAAEKHALEVERAALLAERAANDTRSAAMQATLESRKAAARLEAEKGHPRLAKLNAAYDAYTSAVATRVAAEDVEDSAEAAVRAAVNELLPVGGSSGGAGSSGVVKSARFEETARNESKRSRLKRRLLA